MRCTASIPAGIPDSDNTLPLLLLRSRPGHLCSGTDSQLPGTRSPPELNSGVHIQREIGRKAVATPAQCWEPPRRVGEERAGVAVTAEALLQAGSRRCTGRCARGPHPRCKPHSLGRCRKSILRVGGAGYDTSACLQGAGYFLHVNGQGGPGGGERGGDCEWEATGS